MLHDPLSYTAALAAEYERRRDSVLAALDALPGVTHSRPRGAFYLILGLPVADSEEFARWLLESFALDGETIMLSPLQGFYVTPNRGANEVRLAFVLDEERLARAVRILGEGLQQFAARPPSARTRDGAVNVAAARLWSTLERYSSYGATLTWGASSRPAFSPPDVELRQAPRRRLP